MFIYYSNKAILKANKPNETQQQNCSVTFVSILFIYFVYVKTVRKKGEQWIWHWHQKSRSIIRQFSWEKLRLINSNQSWIHFPTNKKHHCRIILLDVIRRVDRGLSFEFLCDYLETKKMRLQVSAWVSSNERFWSLHQATMVRFYLNIVLKKTVYVYNSIVLNILG